MILSTAYYLYHLLNQEYDKYLLKNHMICCCCCWSLFYLIFNKQKYVMGIIMLTFKLRRNIRALEKTKKKNVLIKSTNNGINNNLDWNIVIISLKGLLAIHKRFHSSFCSIINSYNHPARHFFCLLLNWNPVHQNNLLISPQF